MFFGATFTRVYVQTYGLKLHPEDYAMVVESREFNGRWYTDVKVWRVNSQDSGNGGGGASAGNQKNDQPDVSTFSDESEGDILPF